MIKKINKIKNLGLVFTDYSWNPKLPYFKNCNLIYGWTGVGKTTLSNLFNIIESGNKKDTSNIEYELEDENGRKYKQTESFNKKIRVFNQDYIENNLKIKEGKAKAITLILGKIKKKISEQIESDTRELEFKNNESKIINDRLEQKNKEKNKRFTEIAKTIYAAITGAAIRNYRKDNAESDFSKLKTKELLSPKDLDKFSIVVKQNQKSFIDSIKQIEVEIEPNREVELSKCIKEIIDEAEILLSKTVESQIIDRIKDNQEISNWVETGISIHNKYKSINCEFCGQSLLKERLEKLSKHFNEADKKIKEDIDRLIIELSTVYDIISKINFPDKANFYGELQKNYTNDYKKFLQEKENLLKSIEESKKEIASKKAKTTEIVKLSKKINVSTFISLFNCIESHIARHNKITTDFENEKESVIIKLKNHYLSTIFDNIKNIEQEIKDDEIALNILKNGDPKKKDDFGISDLSKIIINNQVKISSDGKACDEINKGLAIFLGRDELHFEPHKIKVLNNTGQEEEIGDGYILKRNNKIINKLSEGEKTAIAFVYFTVYLKEKNFDLKNGIVVIDDPVSSLDSNSLFQAFAFLKNSVKEAKQIFVFTHNFEFLKLLLNWRKNVEHGKTTSYFMIKNYYNDILKRRCAYLDKMDKELRDYESEYHYLFKILKEFKSDGTIAQSYPIPNIARKVLDTFLLFRVPSGCTIYKKLERIKEDTNFNENKLTAIYKFVNDQSHITGSGFNPSLVPETQKNVAYLLDMIKTASPQHYKILEKSINS